MFRIARPVGFLLLSAAALAGALRLVAQQASAPSPEPRVLLPPVESEVVYVDAFVSDKEGRAVAGLQPSDFEVFEDGQRVEIVNFSAGAGAPPVVDESEASVSVPDAPPAPARAPVPASPERQVNLAIYVDNFNLHPVNRKRAFDQLQRYLVDLPPGHRVMVVSHDQGFRVRRAFTDDLAAVRETLKGMEKDHGGGADLEAERRRIARQLEAGAGAAQGSARSDPVAADASMGLVVELVRRYTEREVQVARQSLSELQRFVALMGGLPGRKVVLYVADGLSTRPGDAMRQALLNSLGPAGERRIRGDMSIPTLFGDSGEQDQQSGFRGVVTLANANRVTLYAVNARSAQAEFGVSADEASSGPLGEGRVWDSGVAAQDQLDRASSLAYLASATGGLTFQVNSKMADRLKGMSADLSSTYALAYVPGHVGDGKFHKIQVKVARPGLSVRHREGYRDKTPDERVADLAYSALLLDPGNPLGVALEAGKPTPAKKGLFDVPLLVKVPVNKLRLVREGDADVGRMMFYFVVQDKRGGMSDVQKRQVPVRFPAGKVRPGQKQVAGFPMPLSMKRGEYVVGVAVVDELTALRSATSLKLVL